MDRVSFAFIGMTVGILAVIFMLIYPIIAVILFAFIFGTVVGGGVDFYRDHIVPLLKQFWNSQKTQTAKKAKPKTGAKKK